MTSLRVAMPSSRTVGLSAKNNVAARARSPIGASVVGRHGYAVRIQSRRSVLMAAKPEEGSSSAADEEDDDLLPIERELAKRKPKKRVKIIAPAVEEARGERPTSPASEFEANVLSVLSFLGGLVIFLGVFLAASGFLPEEIDNFAANVLYPAYTPFVGVFLTCSTAYGVWKSRQ